MKSYLAIALALCSGVLLSADRTFSSAGGDLANPANWYDGMLPVNDVGVVNQAGNYTLANDVTFYSFKVNVGGCYFDFGNFELKVGKDKESVLCNPENEQPIVFNGGVFDLSEVGYIVPCNNVTNPGIVTFDNGCVITNVARFYATKNSVTGARVRLAGGSKVYAGYLAVHNGVGTDNILDICDGGKVSVTGYLYADVNGTVNTYGGHVLNVIGNGSLLEYKSESDVQWGFKQGSNTLRVSDGANVLFSTTKEFKIGGSGSNYCVTNNALVVERSATASIPKIASNTDCNRIFVGDGATLTSETIRFNSCGNELILSNANLSCSSEFNLASLSTSSGNVIRVVGIGADDVLNLPSLEKWFPDGHHNMISVEGGTKWSKSIEVLFTNTHHSVFRVAGKNTVFGNYTNPGNWFSIGARERSNQVTAACASNVVEVTDGAEFNVRRFLLVGIANALVVSNATVNVANNDAETTGFRIGYVPSNSNNVTPTNCLVRLCGINPKINVYKGGNTCFFLNNSVLRFEIPKVGYVDNHVPISVAGNLSFERGCRLEIDCEEFARFRGGIITLIQTGEKINDSDTDQKNYQKYIRESVNELPEGCRLKVSDFSVKLYCPRGFAISIR